MDADARALPVAASHPFYQRSNQILDEKNQILDEKNQILDEKKFDKYVEAICERFYAGEVGRADVMF